jgi:hypothetical protein
MINSKTGVGKSLVLILAFGIIAILLIFVTLFSKNLMQDTIDRTSNELQTYSTDMGLDASINTKLEEFKTDYSGIVMPIDQLFLIAWLVLFMVSLLSAYFAPPLPTFNFFSFLLIGILFFMFVSNFLYQVMEYLQKELLDDVFTATELYLPVFNYYMSNYYVIVPIWITLILFVNQMSRRPESYERKLEEEVLE